MTLEAGSQGDKLPSASLGTLVFGGLGHHYIIKATPLCQATWRGHKGVAHSPRWVPRWWSADAIGVKTPPSDSSSHCPITSSSWVLPAEASANIEKKQTAHCAFSESLTHRICKQNQVVVFKLPNVGAIYFAAIKTERNFNIWLSIFLSVSQFEKRNLFFKYVFLQLLIRLKTSFYKY